MEDFSNKPNSSNSQVDTESSNPEDCKNKSHSRTVGIILIIAMILSAVYFCNRSLFHNSRGYNDVIIKNVKEMVRLNTLTVIDESFYEVPAVNGSNDTLQYRYIVESKTTIGFDLDSLEFEYDQDGTLIIYLPNNTINTKMLNAPQRVSVGGQSMWAKMWSRHDGTDNISTNMALAALSDSVKVRMMEKVRNDGLIEKAHDIACENLAKLFSMLKGNVKVVNNQNVRDESQNIELINNTPNISDVENQLNVAK